MAANVQSLRVELCEGDDHAKVDKKVAVGVIINGGDGNDKLEGGSGNDVLIGGPGRDELKGRRWPERRFRSRWHDKLVGGAGDDKLDGGNGPGHFSGGSGDEYDDIVDDLINDASDNVALLTVGEELFDDAAEDEIKGDKKNRDVFFVDLDDADDDDDDISGEEGDRLIEIG